VIRSLISYAVKNPAVIILAAFLLLIGGIYATYNLELEIMPDISIPIVTVVTVYPGAAAEEVLDKVTKPLERELKGVKGLKNLNSTSAENISVISLEFDYNQDMKEIERTINDKINDVTLPENVQKPKVSRISFKSIPVLKYSVSGNRSEAEIEKILKEKVIDELTGVPGVGEVQLAGEINNVYFVKVDPEKLKQYNLTFNQIKQLLAANNLSFPGGSTEIKGYTLPVRTTYRIKSLEDLKNLPLFITEMPKMEIKAPGKVSMPKIVGTNPPPQRSIPAVNQLPSIPGAVYPPGVPNITYGGEDFRLNLLQKQIEGLSLGLSMQQQMLLGLFNMQTTFMENLGKAFAASKPAIKIIYLKDIAKVYQGYSEKTIISRTNSKTALGLDILKDADANTVTVVENVKKKLSELQKDLPSDIKFILLRDQSIDIIKSVSGMVREGILGAIFAALVILLFLKNGRATLVAAVSIPLSVLIGLLVISKYGITLNSMTLGGLAVAVGRVVDDSIVVIENIYRHLQKGKKDNINELVIDATAEVGSAITASTLTTAAVFLPLGMVSGIIGKIFLPFALTVVFSLLASLLVALTIVPILAKVFFARGQIKVEHEGFLTRNYKKLLVYSLSHKGLVLVLAFVIFASSLLLIPNIGATFLPSMLEKAILIKFETPAGTSLEAMNERVKIIEKKLTNIQDIEIYNVTIGSIPGKVNNRGKVEGSNIANFYLKLKDSADVEKVSKQLRSELKNLPIDGTINVVNYNMMGGGNEQIEVVITGKNYQNIKKAAQIITQKLSQLDGLANVQNNLLTSQPEIVVEVNPEKAAAYGLTTMQVALTVKDMLSPTKVTTVTIGDKSYDVLASLDTKNLKNLSDLGKIKIDTMQGQVEIGNIARVAKKESPVSILRRNQAEFALISGDITVKDSASLSKKVQKIIDSSKLPSDVVVTMAGTTQQMNEGFSQMGMATLSAILLVYIVMVATFGEAKAPFTILFALPLAVIGSLVLLYLTNTPISMSALIGFLMLVGIVVTNAIVLIDRVQQLRQKGLSIQLALIEAGSTRLRPILMTAFATIFALLPLALGLSEGALISQSLAIVVIGGLTTSTLLTLVVVPVVYSLLFKDKATTL